MRRPIWWTSLVSLAAAACASTTPGARPHDMSAHQHEREGQAHSGMAETHTGRYDPNATVEQTKCSPSVGRRSADPDTCWTSASNPTAEHLREAQEHRRHAADHRAASAALRDAEARACVGISSHDRDMSPFEHVEDIATVEPLTESSGTAEVPSKRTTGAVVTFRAVPGMTAQWLQRVVDCHLARNASLGHVVPEMPNCPLVPNGIQARVTSGKNGFVVAIQSDDPATAREILTRAERLQPRP